MGSKLKTYKTANKCPVGCFWDVQDTKELRYLLVLPKENYLAEDFPDLTDLQLSELMSIYKDIENNLPESAYNKVSINNRYRLAYLEYKSLTGTDRENARYLMRFREEKKRQEIESKLIKKTENNRIKDVAILETELNISIDIYSCTIEKYYAYNDLFNKKQNELKKLNRKNNGR